jgi:hypothetical protein
MVLFGGKMIRKSLYMFSKEVIFFKNFWSTQLNPWMWNSQKRKDNYICFQAGHSQIFCLEL